MSCLLDKKISKIKYPTRCLKNIRRAASEPICVHCQRDCPFAGKQRSYKKKEVV